MKFATSNKIDKWIANHSKYRCAPCVIAGEQIVYIVYKPLSSGIVECQTAKCLCCGKEFTDYVD